MNFMKNSLQTCNITFLLEFLTILLHYPVEDTKYKSLILCFNLSQLLIQPNFTSLKNSLSDTKHGSRAQLGREF